MSEADLEREEADELRGADAEQKRRRQIRDDLGWVMSSKQGRRFIARLLATTGVELPVFNSNGSTMNHTEGRRSIGVELLQELKTQHRDAWLRMVNETTPEAKP